MDGTKPISERERERERERDGKTYLKGVEFSNGIKEATVVDGKWSCRNRATKLVTQI